MRAWRSHRGVGNAPSCTDTQHAQHCCWLSLLLAAFLRVESAEAEREKGLAQGRVMSSSSRRYPLMHTPTRREDGTRPLSIKNSNTFMLAIRREYFQPVSPEHRRPLFSQQTLMAASRLGRRSVCLLVVKGIAPAPPAPKIETRAATPPAEARKAESGTEPREATAAAIPGAASPAVSARRRPPPKAAPASDTHSRRHGLGVLPKDYSAAALRRVTRKAKAPPESAAFRRTRYL